MKAGDEIRFRDGDRVLTLYVERELPTEPDDHRSYIVGWCPELRNTMVVHSRNVVQPEQAQA